MQHTPFLMPAAGHFKMLEDAEQIVRVSDDVIKGAVFGSFTLHPREGNTGNTSGEAGHCYLNALGMPNRGLAYLRENLSEFLSIMRGRKTWISIAPIEKGDLAEMAEFIGSLDEVNAVDLIVEVNLGCPNVWGESGQKGIISYDLGAVEEAILEVRKARQGTFDIPIFAKVSPQLPHMVQPLVDTLCTHGVEGITVMNTWPNGMWFEDDGKEMLSTTYGGVSGAGILPIALGQVKMFRDAISNCTTKRHLVELIGVGGIDSGRAVQQHLFAGATAVQVGTHCFTYGLGVFGEIMSEYLDIVTK